MGTPTTFHFHLAINKDPLEEKFSARRTTIFLIDHELIICPKGILCQSHEGNKTNSNQEGLRFQNFLIQSCGIVLLEIDNIPV